MKEEYSACFKSVCWVFENNKTKQIWFPFSNCRRIWWCSLREQRCAFRVGTFSKGFEVFKSSYIFEIYLKWLKNRVTQVNRHLALHSWKWAFWNSAGRSNVLWLHRSCLQLRRTNWVNSWHKNRLFTQRWFTFRIGFENWRNLCNKSKIRWHEDKSKVKSWRCVLI